jgi:uncharacterized protein (TIGR02145 family)
MKTGIILFLVLLTIGLQAQVAVNTDGSNPDNSAMLDVQSINSGVLVPRMTQAQREAIAAPATGLLVFQLDQVPGFYFNSGSPDEPSWMLLSGSPPPGLDVVLLQGNDAGGVQIKNIADPSAPQDAASKAYVDALESYLVEAGILPLRDIDGNVYTTVTIGTQTWTVENLRVSRYTNGDPIPNVTAGNDWINLTTGAWCWFYNDFQYEGIYGKLYNWYVINDPRSLCPAGWHVPADTEWQVLIDYLGGWEVAGAKLKSTGTLEAGTGLWASPNTGATNESGFTALPGGMRDSDSQFHFLNSIGHWWSSTELSPEAAWERVLYYDGIHVARHGFDKRRGFSVRCIKTD